MWKTSSNLIKSVPFHLRLQCHRQTIVNQLSKATVSNELRHRYLLTAASFQNKRFVSNFHSNQSHEDKQHNHHESRQSFGKPVSVLLGLSFWELVTGKDSVEETDEDKLIKTIKRGVLLIQKGEYKAAERMLHLALKTAQELQNHDGITYIYDVLANLALEAGDFDKAEKLFVQVMQRLFGDGYKEDSTKMLHLSAKMAHLCHFQGNLDKAIKGFLWTIEKLEQKVKQFSQDKELFELLGLVKNWYAQALMDKQLFADARKHFQEAYDIYVEIHGTKTEEAVMLLNYLSVAASETGDVVSAITYLKDAIKLANEFPKMVEIGVYHANLGLLYLKQGLTNEALEACKLARRLGIKYSDKDSVELADYCIEELKKVKISKQ